ncbi:2OG-Fe(II) oxygenase [Aurantimonas sp. VKM B-3413]|uniref:2OG-Fe(II) oxygenase n=1 Tax=Aurantimonas sp. VKM B-3413 TaxID=2779401 RepID=UPI00351D3F5D|nr:2OG-Fe(II) oxygenase [Aurantimonas sp. VKM B-3413]
MRGASVVEGLSSDGLSAVADRHAHALRVPDFVDRRLAKDLSDWFASHPFRCNYATLRLSKQSPFQPSTTDRVGPVFSELIPFLRSPSSPEGARAILKYEGQRDRLICEYRSFLRGRESPIEKFHSVLSSIWPEGAILANFHGIFPYVGVARIEGSSALDFSKDPHVDWLASAVHPLSGQLSAIIYLEMPSRGGELEIWNVPQTRVASDLQLDGTMKREDLPQPLTIAPKEGELIIINTRQPHAVKGFSRGARVVQTIFLGYQPRQPLILWS